jgi:ferric-dicitrate binding protein FerR (iron transport regulator)
MKTELPKEIVFSYFAGHASVLQKKLIEQWLAEPGNAEIYFEWLQEWETSQPQFLADSDAAFKKFNERTRRTSENVPNEIGDKTIEKWQATRIGFQWKWVALVILSLGIGLYSARDFVFSKTYYAGYRETKTILLSDSSRVILNSNSSLRVPRWGFGFYSREVFLKGEAEFTVTHTVDNTKFVVYTADQSRVTVLGTEFVVYARNKGTRVVLNKGKVELATSKDPEPHPMRPGEKAIISTSGKIEVRKLQKTEVEETSVWQLHEFNFHQTKLGAAAKEMNDVFGVNIVVADQDLAARELSGTFKAQSADELLNALAQMLDMKIDLKDDKLYLTPNL